MTRTDIDIAKDNAIRDAETLVSALNNLREIRNHTAYSALKELEASLDDLRELVRLDKIGDDIDRADDNKHYNAAILNGKLASLDVTLEKLPKNQARTRDEWMVYHDQQVIGFISHWDHSHWHAMDAHGKTLGSLPRSKNAAILNVKLALLAERV